MKTLSEWVTQAVLEIVRRGRYLPQKRLEERELSKEWQRLRTKACPLCHKLRVLVHDHCHQCGRQRGLICGACNGNLGRAERGKRQPSSDELQYLLCKCSCFQQLLRGP